VRGEWAVVDARGAGPCYGMEVATAADGGGDCTMMR